MASHRENPLETVWKNYAKVFDEFDDMTLARWLSQTASQLHGKIWRFSHPLISAYRLAAMVGHDRQIWLKRLATPPDTYPKAGCCWAPLIPLFTRDSHETGLTCIHCAGTAVEFEELPADVQPSIRDWCLQYDDYHQVAHWDTARQEQAVSYEEALEAAASEGEKLLAAARRDIMPLLSEISPALVWEDQDECLEIRPEDISVDE